MISASWRRATRLRDEGIEARTRTARMFGPRKSPITPRAIRALHNSVAIGKPERDLISPFFWPRRRHQRQLRTLDKDHRQEYVEQLVGLRLGRTKSRPVKMPTAESSAARKRMGGVPTRMQSIA
jgi:hypothetical protein